MSSVAIQPSTATALLVMDVQKGGVARFPDGAAYLERLAKGIAAARAAHIPVIYVVVQFREGHPEISPRNGTFAGIAAAGRLTSGDPATEIPPEIAPARGEVVVVKHRISSFVGSELELVLRAREINFLVLTGISTSGVVLSTLRHAADLDFGQTVLGDACLDGDPELHRILVEKVFPRQAHVTTVAEWIQGLSEAP
jgi:nicotinamidase-related amidase